MHRPVVGCVGLDFLGRFHHFRILRYSTLSGKCTVTPKKAAPGMPLIFMARCAALYFR